jgi:hypothetical protein
MVAAFGSSGGDVAISAYASAVALNNAFTAHTEILASLAFTEQILAFKRFGKLGTSSHCQGPRPGDQHRSERREAHDPLRHAIQHRFHGALCDHRAQ